MASRETRNETIDGEEARSCCGGRKRRTACPCPENCPKARWLCLAALIGGLGILAFRTARRHCDHAPAAG